MASDISNTCESHYLVSWPEPPFPRTAACVSGLLQLASLGDFLTKNKGFLLLQTSNKSLWKTKFENYLLKKMKNSKDQKLHLLRWPKTQQFLKLKRFNYRSKTSSVFSKIWSTKLVEGKEQLPINTWSSGIFHPSLQNYCELSMAPRQLSHFLRSRDPKGRCRTYGGIRSPTSFSRAQAFY